MKLNDAHFCAQLNSSLELKPIRRSFDSGSKLTEMQHELLLSFLSLKGVNSHLEVKKRSLKKKDFGGGI